MFLAFHRDLQQGWERAYCLSFSSSIATKVHAGARIINFYKDVYHAKINDSDWSEAVNVDAADAGVEFFVDACRRS